MSEMRGLCERHQTLYFETACPSCDNQALRERIGTIESALAEAQRERDAEARKRSNACVAVVLAQEIIGKTLSECNFLRARLDKGKVQVEALQYANDWFDEMADEGTLNATVDLREVIKTTLDAQERG